MTSRPPYSVVAGAVFGAGLYFFLLDPKLLDPAYWIWLMDGDPAAQYLGWRFFRDEPWRWPPGVIRSYGLEIGSGIVFTDSIPLAAFVAKLFSPLLPTPFQYFGIWVLACFVLQGAFAGLLATLASDRPVQRLLVTLLLAASLPVVDRAIGHYALMSHWLLLWGLWLALRPHRELATAQWAALTAVASLIHAYLLYMALALWVADVLRRRHFDPLPRPGWGDWVRHVTIVTIALAATMALAGYFDSPRHAMSGGAYYFGKYAANLNAFFNPGWGSRFLPNLPVIKGSELEGYGYLGLGVLVLLGVAALALVRRGGPPVNWRPYVPLAAVAVALWAISLSHLIAWGDRVVVELPLKGRWLELVATLRASGRLIWVAFYALTFAATAIACALRAGGGDGAPDRRRRAAGRRPLAEVRHDARLFRRPLPRPAGETRHLPHLAVLGGGVEGVQDDPGRAGREHGARLGLALALRRRPRHGDQHRPVLAAVVPADGGGQRRDHAHAGERTARRRHALPAVVEGHALRLRDRTGRRFRPDRHLLRDRARVVRETARTDRARRPRTRSGQGNRALIAVPSSTRPQAPPPRLRSSSSSPRSWILRVSVLRPQPSFCAASIR